MKKNIILGIGAILLMLGAYFFGFSQGEKNIPVPVKNTPAETQEIQQKTPEELAIDQCMSNAHLQCRDAFTLKNATENFSCDDLLTTEKQESCRTTQIIKKVQNTADENLCEKISSPLEKSGCIITAVSQKAAESENISLCDPLDKISKKYCIEQSIQKIIEKNPDTKWCEYFNDFDGPEKDMCLSSVETILREKNAPNPEDILTNQESPEATPVTDPVGDIKDLPLPDTDIQTPSGEPESSLPLE